MSESNPYEPSKATGSGRAVTFPYLVTLIVAIFISLIVGYMTCYVTIGYEYERRYADYADQTAKDLQKMARDQADKSGSP